MKRLAIRIGNKSVSSNRRSLREESTCAVVPGLYCRVRNENECYPRPVAADNMFLPGQVLKALQMRKIFTAKKGSNPAIRSWFAVQPSNTSRCFLALPYRCPKRSNLLVKRKNTRIFKTIRKVAQNLETAFNLQNLCSPFKGVMSIHESFPRLSWFGR